MIDQNDIKDNILCRECLKRHTCKYKDEFEQSKIEVANIKGDPLSPIRIIVACIGFIHDDSVITEFKGEFIYE